MLEIQNRTPFAVDLAPAMDRDGYDHAVCAIKGTFTPSLNPEDPPRAEEQLPVLQADEHHGEPGESSIRYEMDTCLCKRGTDVILNGTAVPPNPARRMDVALKAGPVRKVVRVVGNRRWQRNLGVWQAGDPEPFSEMPLVWERSFGGRDESHDNPDKHSFEDRNPVGTGFAARRSGDRLDGLALPNLEDPKQPIKRWKDKPPPAGFGFIDRHWQPRAGYGGTYDDKWQQKRMPLLPDDFDERFFNGAPVGQISQKFFAGGEAVSVRNLKPDGEIAFQVPRRRFQVRTWIRGEPFNTEPVLDTVIIEPDDDRVIVIWRATIRCPRKFLYIDCIRVSEEEAT